MRIGILHGYELTGSGSNEYNRYLSRALAQAGHEVHLLCREPRPEAIAHVTRAYDVDGRELFAREGEGTCVVHLLPHASVRPVYLTDKQREGNVKAFVDLTDAELRECHEVSVCAVEDILRRHPVDMLHANHLVWQPSVAAELETPFVVYPHGSSIEYTLRRDVRCREAARAALLRANGLISGSREVLERILELYPEDADALRAKSAIVGVGVDTALFRPVARGDRLASVARARGDYGGKDPALAADLRERLDRGDYGAIDAYHDAYVHAVPDADLNAKLGAIPWESGRVLLFVGALAVGKGVHSLLAALPQVPDAHLVVVGSGAYREVLEALVHAIARGDQKLFDHLAAHGFDLDRSDLAGGWDDVGGPVPHDPGLEERVHFLGRLDHGLLRHVFPCADLAVFPSVVPEAYPLVLMESLSNGVLPVVSDFSGFADGLEILKPLLGKELVDGMRLPVAPAGRVDGIAARLNALLADPGLAKRAGRLRAIAIQRFDWSVRADEMVEAYRRFARPPTS